ncbi:uncharacterized protein F4812DRAFT_457358 [Daldinia caldariorum]|uniref:uncharacterized protein n=1 Tax=Daldinia caldariorum TaxID=326644 RepID=UPI0020082A15|nr:uncharacterized protein F4812DRAFT_457358 [Daldinia caldariorum]KAI1469962.1 hypothetical protein F4812DRAFT_457358 [Daldinia caldariorum]
MAHTRMPLWESSPTPSGDDMIDPVLALPLESTLTTTTTVKRKRASKPKVRTGCITWIRRVKCDETKPACTRCTSTGRKCDGYEGMPPPRPKKPAAAASLPPSSSSASPDPQQLISATAPFPSPAVFGGADGYLARRQDLARNSFAAACRGNSALQVLRPLAADIQGTEEERAYFHRFRRAAEAGLALHASRLGTSFWRRLVPQVGRSDAAIRHALIALGAAYESMQWQQSQQERHNQTQNQSYQTTTTTTTMKLQQRVPRTSPSPRGGSPAAEQPYISTPPPEDNYQCGDQLELFMIRQYNLSIYHLQRHVQPGSPPESVETTLICCLIFVCIETSRGSEAAALAHVANGLQIIRALPADSELMYLSSNRGGGHSESSSSSSNQGYSSSREASGFPPRISRSDWRQLLDFFLSLEPRAAIHYYTSSQPASPSYPPAAAWENTPEWYGEMISQWDVEGTEGEMRH